jgi:hypothetical protein
MKKLVIIITVLMSISLSSLAQVNPHAIGLRFGGDGNINGAEISYQQAFGDVNRLELDLGFKGYRNYNDMFVAGIYHWVWNLNGGLNWYAGPGAAVGFYNWDDGTTNDSGISLGIGGQIGLEFDFNELGAPILISMDARPMIDVVGYDNGFGWGAALGVRYTW